MHNLLNRNRNANYFHNQIYLFTLISFEIQAVLTLQEVCRLKLMHIRTVQLEDYIKSLLKSILKSLKVQGLLRK